MKSRVKQLVAQASEHRSRRTERHYAAASHRIPGAEAFDGLTPHSLAFAASKYTSQGAPAVNLILPEFSQSAFFAGIRTAVEFAASLAVELDRSIRIVHLHGHLKAGERQALETAVRSDFNVPASREISVWGGYALETLEFGKDDCWVATHWTTAHALDVACQLGKLSSAQVLYLVQDYEPGFYAWSSTYTLARSTYRAGFTCVANSAPVQHYLAAYENLNVADELVFRPRLDLARLASAAAPVEFDRREPQVTFYARPRKPRNMYSVGMTALQLAVAELASEGEPVRVVSFGDSHPRPRGSLASMEIRGKMPWDRYFDEIRRTDVLLSLQMSPHPSHPPLDAVVAGRTAVTNELGGARGGMHPRLVAVDGDPRALAKGLVAAVQDVKDKGPEPYSEALLLSLGRDMHDVVRDLTNRVG